MSSKSTTHRALLALSLLCLGLATMTSASPIPTDDTVAVSTDLPPAPPAAVVEWIDNASVGEDLIFASSAYIVDDVVEIATNDTSDATKRETAPQTTWYTQVNVDRTGTWPDCWATASNCMTGDRAPAGGSTTIQTSYSRSFSISFGLDAGLASNVEGVINGNGGLSLGFQWTKSWSWSTAYSCNVNSDVQVAQIFVKPLMGWADTATRQCSYNYIQGTQCGGWTFGHIDFPIKSNGQPAVQGGCSQRWANVHCDVPVGTKYC